ncbi:hypothetical protein PAXRUDRAFT_146977 [Paxillus rubicundulus Ve08.2h10]|uniref:Unplaced genomic scaffold scaffold_441, whole genome shotgun sequence n=1 Tax=Paxillus rubicundulus Ve08.2h10 TaxID=930991 RepID=A0A0D0E576_9AGAM|nr:hypothetical protein PAXRUDRAFT_146977 [Paxillus rubicundulus Ve08.2h10]
MFAASRDASVAKCGGSFSTDDQSSTRNKSDKSLAASQGPQLYTGELGVPSQSLRTTDSHHDDLPITALGRTPQSHIPSTHSSPIISSSTGYRSHFQSPHSSVASDSSPGASVGYRSECGGLTPGSSCAHSPVLGPTSSSHLPSSFLRSATEPDTHPPTPQPPHKPHAGCLPARPSTASHRPFIPPLTDESSPEDFRSRTYEKTTTRLSLGIKNLLAKPALFSPSRFSVHSTTLSSDGEVSFRSQNATVTHTTTPRKWRPPNLDVPACLSTTSNPSPSSPPIDAHRRYASEAKMYSSPVGRALPTSQESLDISAHRVPPPSHGRDQKPRNVLRRRRSAKLVKERHRERESVDKNAPASPAEHDVAPRTLSKDARFRDGTIPLELTPAGAVVEAYKQQTLCREDACAHKQYMDTQELVASPQAFQGGGEENKPLHSPVPYYTVFGTSSGRRVAAGGPDDRWSYYPPDQRGAGTSPQADAGSRSLTRKVSARWKKVRGGSVVPEESHCQSDVDYAKSRPSLQEVLSRGRLAGRSIDGIPDSRDEVWAGPLAGYGQSGMDQRSGKAQTSVKETSEGGRLWKLVKRISTGGLRERFQNETAVPPVPAIPKELLGKVNPAVRNDHLPEATLRHASTPRQPSRHCQSGSYHEKDRGSAPKTIPWSHSSLATASSSPNSSDVASTQFFHKTPSARSSVSSYGEAKVPPVPEIVLDRHIITPLEQLRLGEDHVDPEESRSHSPRRSASVPAGLRDCANTAQPSSSNKICQGEICPLTSNSKPKSESTAWSPLADGGVSLSPPPPRLQRGLKRGGGSSGPTSPSSHSAKNAEGSAVEALQLDRASPGTQSDASTTKPRPRSNSLTSRSASMSDHSHERSQLTFRELDAPRRPPLSEREKADIWDDLLARSDKAGGTLHLGVGELMSDNMRFSGYSETS